MAKHPVVKTKNAATSQRMKTYWENRRNKMTPPPAPPPVTEKNPHAQALGRLGGTRNTEAQVNARLKNAKRAGRRGRVCLHCGEPVLGGHKDKRLDESCHSRAWTWAEPRNRREPK